MIRVKVEQASDWERKEIVEVSERRFAEFLKGLYVRTIVEYPRPNENVDYDVTVTVYDTYVE